MKAKAVTKSKVIVTKSDNTDYGNRVYIKHSDGFISMYAHLDTIDVKVGQELIKGDSIGDIGSTGYSPNGAHLHYSLFAPETVGLYARNTIDPAYYLELNGYPTDTVITNPYGSAICNPVLSGHEGIDFSSWRLKK